MLFSPVECAHYRSGKDEQLFVYLSELTYFLQNSKTMDKSLSDILEIYRLVVHQHFTKDEALRKVAGESGAGGAEVLSSCAKYLNITPQNLDYFLEKKNHFNFENFLLRRFPEYEDKIFQFFNVYENVSDVPVLDFSQIIKSPSHHKKKSQNRQVILSSVRESFLDWIARQDVPQDVKEELKGWITKIDGKDQKI